MDVAQRFWKKVDTSGSCWLWTGARSEGGYASFYIRRRRVRAHRVAWTLTRGTVPGGLHVLHRCDVRACVNPDHLFLGTNADNIADKVAKGRQTRGEAMPMAKLTEARVSVIKARLRDGAVQAQIAREYRMSPTAINSIALGRKWKHVAPDATVLSNTG